MPVEMGRIKNVLGDRILVKRVGAPEKRGGLFLPTHGNKPKQSELWYGIVEHLGQDARYPEAYGLKIGDLVGIEFTGSHSESFNGDDGSYHTWVPEEFIACRDEGIISDFQKGEKWTKKETGVTPVGSYVVVEPYPESDTHNGIQIPDSSREAQRVGKVLSVSSGEVRGDSLYPLQIEAGCDVLYGRYSGQRLDLGEKEYLLMKVEDIIATMEKRKEVANV